MPSRPRTPTTAIALVLGAVAPATIASAQTAQTPADGVLLYDTRVRPLLEARCLKCHGADPERLRSGLSLATRAGVLRGGARGPAIDTGNPRRSRLLRAIGWEDDDLQMPPSARLRDEEIDVLRQWVDLGAPYGRDEDDLVAVETDDAVTISDEDRAWWSLVPPARPEVPAVDDADWPANDSDRFVLARLEAAGLAPAPDAGRVALLRRATYDLTGLPPTAEAVTEFVADERPDAFERRVDALLASPQYGVRWGRHWLDLVRFAETDSYERDRPKPGAWRYRDWVIDALNADMPYDEFFFNDTATTEIYTPTAASIIATGYLRLGIWDDEPTDTTLAQYDDLDSILDTTSRVVLGVSMGCARCHDHKGDPIPQTDYYRMLAFFRGIAPYKVGGGNAPTPANYVDRIAEDLGAPDAGRALAAWEAERAGLLSAVREIAAAVRERAGDDALRTVASERDRGLVAHLGLEDETPLVAVDETGRHHGRVEDATVGATGVHGRAFTFDGRDDAVRIERPVADDFTIAVWFRTTAPAPGGTDLRWFRGSGLVDGEVPGIVNDFGLALVGDGYVTAGAGNPETFLASGAGHHDGAWHHAVLTRHRATGALRLYVDGEPVADGVGSTGPLDTPAFLDIGRMQPGHGFFRGDLDDVRIYERVLDDREVLDLFLGGAAGAAFTALVAEHRPADAERHAAAVERLLALRKPERRMIEVLRVKEVGPAPPETHVFIRGNPHAPAARVEPGVPVILDQRTVEIPAPSPDAATSGRRLALARWIVDASNPRTARVMANRLWQYHFGRGLVRTPNDFGRFGVAPTHPALLDWLAAELVDRGWSLKAMHRLIMTSRAYRMSSAGDADALARDPVNDLLWRFDMRRLAAEEIRDSMLAANGTLNLQMGGPGVYPPMPEEILATASRPGQAWGRSTPDQAARRSVYIHVKRSLLTPLLETLDLADTDATCPVRFVTTQPTQALTLLNGTFVNEQATLFAERVRREAGDDVADRVGRALEIALSRPADAAEVADGVGLVRAMEREEGFTPDAAFASYCLVLLNLNEFVYLD
jgi:cytochrome c553